MRAYCIILIFFTTHGYGQICNCQNDSFLNEIISCDTTVFQNGSKLYRQFNCDSSWLTFENKNGKKTILYTLNGLVPLTERLGYVNWTEYKNTFLIQDNQISGCCDPPNFILYNKNKGTIINSIGTIVFNSEIPSLPYVVYFTDTNFNSLTFLNVDNNKKFKIQLPKGRIKKTLAVSDEMFPEHLFDEINLEHGILKMTYRYKIKAEENDWHNEKISIDIKKYSS